MSLRCTSWLCIYSIYWWTIVYMHIHIFTCKCTCILSLCSYIATCVQCLIILGKPIYLWYHWIHWNLIPILAFTPYGYSTWLVRIKMYWAVSTSTLGPWPWMIRITIIHSIPLIVWADNMGMPGNSKESWLINENNQSASYQLNNSNYSYWLIFHLMPFFMGKN